MSVNCSCKNLTKSRTTSAAHQQVQLMIFRLLAMPVTCVAKYSPVPDNFQPTSGQNIKLSATFANLLVTSLVVQSVALISTVAHD
eukprot:9144676-Karenia_brevis.AAC.1